MAARVTEKNCYAQISPIMYFINFSHFVYFKIFQRWNFHISLSLNLYPIWIYIIFQIITHLSKQSKLVKRGIPSFIDFKFFCMFRYGFRVVWFLSLCIIDFHRSDVSSQKMTQYKLIQDCFEANIIFKLLIWMLYILVRMGWN